MKDFIFQKDLRGGKQTPLQGRICCLDDILYKEPVSEFWRFWHFENKLEKTRDQVCSSLSGPKGPGFKVLMPQVFIYSNNIKSILRWLKVLDRP